MREAVRRTVLFSMERLLVRGAHYRFLLVVALIGFVSVVGGMLLLAGGGQDEGPREAIWWAFLRLSDPGYLGDDEGLWKRTISTTLTVLGYVIFMGAMVAILTQWLNETLNRLTQGLTPIRIDGHVAILGFTNRTPTICRELVVAEGRLSRWLALRNIRRLRIALLDDGDPAEIDRELREDLGEDYRRDQIVLRYGEPLKPNDLERVDVAHAASVVLPGVESTSSEAANHDASVIKTLRSIAASHDEDLPLPTCVCEIFDARKVTTARRAYGGPLQVVASDVVIGRMLGDSLRQPGLSSVYAELVTHGVGGTLYMRTWHGEPTTAGEIVRCVDGPILVAIVGRDGLRLAPGDDTPIATDDALTFVAHAYGDTEPSAPRTLPVATPGLALESASVCRGGRVLLLGWSRRVPDLLAELEDFRAEQWSVDVVSLVSEDDRARDLAEQGVDFVRTQIHHHVADFTIPNTIAGFDPAGYDRVLIIASDWPDTEEQSDARTISAYLTLADVLQGCARMPPVVVELTDADNLPMFDAEPVEVVVSPLILARVLAQVVLRAELLVVIDEIFGTGESEVVFASPVFEGPLPFGRAAAAIRAPGVLALGMRRGGPGGQVLLAPDDDEMLTFSAGDSLIVLRAGSAVGGA